MNRLAVIFTLLACALSSQLMAADAATPPATSDAANFDRQLAKMQQQMQIMQEQMQKIDAAKTDAEKQKLLSEHWNSMQQGMQMMHDMGKSGMMSPAASGMTADQIAERQQMMGQYMGMQQMMMQHMWGHQGCMMGRGHGSMMGQHHMMDMDMWR